MKNIIVFFGGTTVEHDVSVITGVMMLNTLDKRLFNPVPVYIDRNGKWYTGEELFSLDNYKDLDVNKLTQVVIRSGENKLYTIKKKKIKEYCVVYSALNCLHGERGEDGSIAGILSLSFIPFSSPNIVSSAIAMDKDITKKMLKGIGVKTVSGIVIKNQSELVKIKDELSYPVIIKPCLLGSSIGIESAESSNEFLQKARTVFRYDTKVLIEKKICNMIEINCACYKDEQGNLIVSECERPFAKDDILSFNDKYTEGKREFPANIPSDISNKIKAITKKIYEELCFSGIIRIDFFVKGNTVLVNEINSVPGSLAYYLFYPTLKDFSRVLTKLIFISVKNASAKSTLLRDLKTSILNVKGTKGSKRL